MTRADYWQECIGSALEEAGIQATPEQVRAVAEHVEVAVENQSLAFHVPRGSGRNEEAERLREQLKAEREKVQCKECKGTGEEIIYGPYHDSISSCWRCNGEGRHKP